MRPHFREAKLIAVAALHDALYFDSDYTSLQVSPIHKRTDEIFSKGYLRRLLDALAEHQLVSIENSENSDDFYTLTDAGIEVAEGLSTADIMTARYRIGSVRDIVEVPASDRIVSLTHNQVDETDRSLTNVIETLEADNGSPESPGMRERLLGQLKAGRELILSGQFRAYLLYEVLVRALDELIAKYGNPAIAELAKALLGALVGKMLS